MSNTTCFQPLPAAHVIDDWGRFFTPSFAIPLKNEPDPEEQNPAVRLQWAYKIDPSLVDERAVKDLLASEETLFKARKSARDSQKDLLQSRVSQLGEEIGGLDAQVLSKAKLFSGASAEFGGQLDHLVAVRLLQWVGRSMQQGHRCDNECTRDQHHRQPHEHEAHAEEQAHADQPLVDADRQKGLARQAIEGFDLRGGLRALGHARPAALDLLGVETGAVVTDGQFDLPVPAPLSAAEIVRVDGRSFTVTLPPAPDGSAPAMQFALTVKAVLPTPNLNGTLVFNAAGASTIARRGCPSPPAAGRTRSASCSSLTCSPSLPSSWPCSQRPCSRWQSRPRMPRRSTSEPSRCWTRSRLRP